MSKKLGLGTYPFKGHWGEPLSDRVVYDILNKSLDMGIDLIDTADVYGLGQTEALIGKWLKTKNVPNLPLISTKGGRDFTSNPDQITRNFSPSYLQAALDQSLVRLGMDHVYSYFIHGPTETDINRGEIFDFLERIKKAGKTQYGGISVNKPSDISPVLNKYSPDIISLTYNYLSDFDIEAVIKNCTAQKVRLFVREPLCQGALTGKYNRNSVFPETDQRSIKWNPEFWDHNEPELHRFTAKYGPSVENLVQKAITYILDHKQIERVLVGIKSVEQLSSLAKITDK